MGRVIASKVKGMNGWVKGGLVAAFTLLVSVFMYEGWFNPTISDSATNTYRFFVDSSAVNLGADGNTATSLAAGQAIGGKYSLSLATYTGTNYVTVPASTTTANVVSMYGPVYSTDTVLTAPALRLAQRAGSTSGQTLSATFYDYDPNGSAGNGTQIWTATAAAYTSTSTGYSNLTFSSTPSYTLPHGHRVKIVVSAVNASTSAGRLYFYSSTTNSSYFTVSENYPTSTTQVINIGDYNNGNVAGVVQGQQNIAMLTFQMVTNSAASTQWTGGKLDRIGTNANLDDATYAIYLDSNNDGSFNPAVDTKISDETSFTGLSGQQYTLVTPQTITTTAKRYFVVFNIAPAAVAGSTLGARILDETYFTVGANNMNPMTTGASSMLSIIANDAATAVRKSYQADFNSGTTLLAPLSGSTNSTCSTTNTTITAPVTGLLNYPSHTCTSPTTSNYLQITNANAVANSGKIATLYFNGATYAGDVAVKGYQFVFYAGTNGTGSTGTATVTLFYVDPAGNLVDFTGTPGTAALTTTLGSKTVDMSGMSANVPKGSRLGVRINVTAGATAPTYYRFNLSNAAGAKLTVDETAALSNGVDIGDGKVIADASVTAGTAAKVVDAFTMVASLPQTVTGITVSGANSNATNISAVKIYRDNKPAGGDYGTLGDEDVLIGSGTFSGSSAVVPVNESVTTSQTRYLVVYDIAATATVGNKITGLVTALAGASVDVNSDLSSAGLTIIASTVVTEGTGEPASQSVAPGSGAVNLNAFGIYTNGTTDTINTVTVQVSPGTSTAIALMEVVGRTNGTVYGSSTAPISGDTWRMTISGLSATSATPQCYIRITPKASVAGTFYISGLVTAITHAQTSNALFYNDAASATVTIDGVAPSNPSVSATTGTSPGEIDLIWSAATDSNANNSGISYKVVRGLPNAPAPSDCNSGTVVYSGAATTKTDQTGKVDGKNYTFGYRVCAVDGVGNAGAGSTASAAAKLPAICGQAPTIAFVSSPNQYAKIGGNADFVVNVINNDIGDCAPVTFSVALDGATNADNFVDPPAIAPTSVTLNPNGGGANIAVRIKALSSASQGEQESFSVRASGSGNGYAYTATAATPLVATVNEFGPMLHSSFSVGTKYGTWGVESTCNDCHTNAGEATTNIKEISDLVLTPNGRRPVVFQQPSSSTLTSGIFGHDERDDRTKSANICEVCHHQTKFHRYSATTQPFQVNHNGGKDCMVCHPHGSGFKYVGGASDCVSCHGNPPTNKAEMVQSPPTNALGANPPDYGAHQTHDKMKMGCEACHNNYNINVMGNKAMEMGFKISNATYPGFASSVNGGVITVSTNYNTFYNWTTLSAGTTVAKSANQTVPTCNVYCHGGWQGGGGTNTTAAWVGDYQAECGTCHSYTNNDPPTTGSHLKHAKNGNYLVNGSPVGGIGMACDKCHGAFKNFTGSNGFAHVNGSVEWNLNGIAANALYKGSVSGGTGAIAPSSSFGSCQNLYCHSTVQGPDGTGAPTYRTPTWGGAADCGSCHVNMYSDPAATGGHKQHSQPSDKFATPFDCRICHGNGGTTNPLNHANGTINMEFSGYGSNTVYSRGNNVAPGTAFGSCSTSDCHGSRTVTWGQATTITLCDKCHGSASSDGGFYATTGPGTAASNTDPIVGAHNAHIHQVNSAFTLYTSYSAPKDCDECHLKPAGPYDAGHIDTALPAEVTFQPAAIANRQIFYGYSGAAEATYNRSTGYCNNVWCHGGYMDSNRGTGAYANVVADGGTLPTPVAPKWNQPFLNGNPANDCNACHGYPPPGPNESYAHFARYSSTGVAILKSPSECSGCHANLKADGSGFTSGALHINGSVDKGCQACHGVPPTTTADLALPSNGALAPGQAGAHKAHADLPIIGKNCSVCHNNYSVAMPSYTMEIGFNAFNGRVTTGTFWGYSTVNNGLTTYASTSAGTTVYSTNDPTQQNTCAVYCHGLNAAGSAFIGGRYNATAKPEWDDGSSMLCGNCHGVNVATSAAYIQLGYTSTTRQLRPASAPTSSSHPKHVLSASVNLTCDVCHGVVTGFNHVNGSVAWKLDTANPLLGSGATYNGAPSGFTGNLAPSATYGTCNNVYCHSSGQSSDGSSATPVYASVQWGSGTLACSSCHADMSSTGTGSHTAHTAASGANYDCNICHGSGYLKTGVSSTAHVDRQIGVTMSGTTYSKTSPFNPGLGYGQCSASQCHGQGTPTWGVAMYSSVQCQKCHGDANSPAFYSTSYPVQVTATTDAKVGAHNGHLKGALNYSASYGCAACHTNPATVTAAGHMNGATEVDFPAGSPARSGGTTPSYTAADGSCVTYCHGAGFAADTKGSNTTPNWTSQSYLTGTPSPTECGTCHAFPPATEDHASVTLPATLAACHNCHPNVNTDGTFADKTKHINGTVESSVTCVLCHNVAKPSASPDRRQVVGAGGDIDNAKTFHHIQYGSNAISENSCKACHDQANHKSYSDGVNVYLKNLNTGASVVYDGTTATAANLANACASCHDATHSLTTPFSDSGDNSTPKNINWTVGSAAHQAQNACFNCHGNAAAADTTLDPKKSGHGGSTAKMLLYTYNTADTVSAGSNFCYNCHGTTVANGAVDAIQTSFNATYGHNSNKCSDCHNMHSANAGSHTAGSATLAGVLTGATGTGVTTWSSTNWGGVTTYAASATATAEWQVCFKCHAGTNAATGGGLITAPTAAAALTNLGLEFNPNNKAGHPVVASLNNSTGRLTPKPVFAANMKAPWNVNVGTQVMTCTDCHATNTSGQKGPHGSSVKWMLAGTLQAWPYNNVANNGTSSGTYWTLANSNGTQTGPNGIFCMNCHVVYNSNGIHRALQTSSHNGAAWAGTRPCVACHIRVPHGGKVGRLLRGGSADVLGRYAPNGNGGDYVTTSASGTFYLSGYTKGTSATGRGTFRLYGVTSTSATKNAGYGCTSHSGTTGDTW